MPKTNRMPRVVPAIRHGVHGCSPMRRAIVIAATQHTPTEIHAQRRAPRTTALTMPKARARYGGPPCSSRTTSTDAARAVTATTGPGKRLAPMRASGPTRARRMLRVASRGASCADLAIQIAAGTCTRNERMTGTQRVTAGGIRQDGGPAPHGGPPQGSTGSVLIRPGLVPLRVRARAGARHASMLRGRPRGGVLPWEYGGQPNTRLHTGLEFATVCRERVDNQDVDGDDDHRPPWLNRD